MQGTQPDKPSSGTENRLLHGQATEFFQGQPGFRSPYEGANSLPADANIRQTTSVDLFLGARLWTGGEIYLNPEYYQGWGLGDTHGVAAFPNSEAYKIGSNYGFVWFPHIFFRQTFGLGGEQEQIAGDQLQLAGTADVSRVTFTLGRVEVGDQFDANSYAHDGRAQFMNWALVDAGAFDYAANALGGIEGATVELNQKTWALRYGLFDVPSISNGLPVDENFGKAWQQVLELEERYTLFGHPGKARLLGWLESAHMGDYAEAVANHEDISLTEKYRTQYGFVVNLEQELTPNLGAFLRASWRDGHEEVWQFTDIDHGVSLGVQLKGSAWNRPKDVFGFAGAIDGISESHREYLAMGGLGPLIGDGQLQHYGAESVLETYYDALLCDHLHFALDYQLVFNPAYNEDRGPVSIISTRLHFEF